MTASVAVAVDDTDVDNVSVNIDRTDVDSHESVIVDHTDVDNHKSVTFYKPDSVFAEVQGAAKTDVTASVAVAVGKPRPPVRRETQLDTVESLANDTEHQQKQLSTIKFVKFEDSVAIYRPSFMQFKHFPQIVLDGDLCKGIFRYESCSPSVTQSSNMKCTGNRRGSRYFGTKIRYCECCDIYYRDLEVHVKSQRHKMFVASEATYTGVDAVIEEIGQFVVKPAISPHTTDTKPDLSRRRLVEYSSTDVSNAFCPHDFVSMFLP